DLLGEEEADDESREEGEQRLDQPAAQFDQVLEERRLGGLDVLVGHAARPASLAGGAGAAAPGSSCAAATGADAGGASMATGGSAATDGSGAGGGASAVTAGSVVGAPSAAGVAAGSPATGVAAVEDAGFSSNDFSRSLLTLAIGSKPEPMPRVASVMASIDFLRSAISASRMASWN